MTSSLRKLALYKQPSGTRLVILDSRPLRRICDHGFVLVHNYFLRSNGGRALEPPFVHPCPSNDIIEIACADCSSAAIYEFVFTYNYFIDGHTDDVGMKRQLAMIWQYLIYDSEAHKYRYNIDAINEDICHLFKDVGDGSLGLSHSAIQDFVMSASCPSFKSIDNMIPIATPVHSLEQFSSRNTEYSTILPSIDNSRSTDEKAYPIQDSLMTNLQASLQPGIALYLQTLGDESPGAQARYEYFNETASSLQKFICESITQYLMKTIGSNIFLVNRTKTAIPLSVLQRANTYTPYRMNADVRIESESGQHAGIHMTTRWSGIVPEKRDYSQFAWQTILQSLSTHFTDDPSQPTFLVTLVSNEADVASLKLSYFTNPAFDPKNAASAFVSQLASIKPDCVLNYGTIMIGTKSRLFKPIFNSVPFLSPSIRVRLEQFKRDLQFLSRHLLVTGKEGKVFKAPSTLVFRQQHIDNERPYFLFDGFPTHVKAWVYDPCTYTTCPNAPIASIIKGRVTVSFLYVCSILDDDDLCISDFIPGSVTEFLANEKDVIVSDGRVPLDFLDRVLQLFRNVPSVVRVSGHTEDMMPITKLPKISKSPGYAKTLIPLRSTSRRSNIFEITDTSDNKGRLIIPSVGQMLDRMAGLYTTLEGILH